MRSPRLLPVSIVAVVGLTAFGAPRLVVAAPNILVLIADDVGVDKVGVYARDTDYLGYTATATYLPETPTLDELAHAGVYFSDAWAMPLCSPARAIAMTGRYAWRTGVGNTVPEGPELDADTETSLADLLKDPSGETYATAVIGKWHLGLTGDPSGYDFALPDTGGVTSLEIPSTAHPLRMGFDYFSGGINGDVEAYYDWTKTYAAIPGLTLMTNETDWVTDETVNDALDWIGAQTQPWFAWVAFNLAHTSEDTESYQISDVSPDCHTVSCVLDGSCPANGRAIFQAMTECLDQRTEVLLEGMDPATLDNTMIIWMGDNGTPNGIMEAPFANRGSRSTNGKGSMYETGVRVPLMIAQGRNWREWHACSTVQRNTGHCPMTNDLVDFHGREVRANVSTVDLFATIGRLGGHTPTTGDDSMSLVGCLHNPAPNCAGPATSRTRPTYTERFEYTPDEKSGVDVLSYGAAAIRLGDDKLVLRYDATNLCFNYELYDLDADRFELTNLATSDPATLASMKATMAGLGIGWQAGIPDCP